MRKAFKLRSSIKLNNGKKIGIALYGNPNLFPVFYFHGWPGSRLELKNIPINKKKCNIIAIERPGYGLSDSIPNFKILDWPKIVLEIADKLKIKKFSIIGVSGGAPFATACGYSIKNNRLRSVAIVCGLAPHNAEGMNKGRIGLLIQIGKKPIISWFLLNYLRKKLLNDNLERSFIKWKEKIPLPKSDLELFDRARSVRLIKNFQEAIKYGISGVYRDAKLYSSDWNFDLKKIKKKFYIWHGTSDYTVPSITSNYYKKRLKNKKIILKANEGHFSICYNYLNEVIRQVSE
tara:strand:+ start:715 stop:1584 length:870 start_codon:yes stop_codon:yes gene_type:complete